jgi:small subunit ribosomal protein S16
MDARSPRDGKVIEEVGTYHPHTRDSAQEVTIKAERIDYWLSVGAQPSDTVKLLIDKHKGKVAETLLNPAKPRNIVEIKTTGRRGPVVKTPVAAEAPVAEAAVESATEAPAAEGATEAPAGDAAESAS